MEILKINNKNYKEIVNHTVDLIKKGKVVIFPTDTVYGFLADASNKKAVNRVFTIKQRDKKKYLPLFIKDVKTAKSLAVVNNAQEKLLKKYWPGKVTVVLQRNRKIKLFGVAKNTIALRIPNYRFLNELLNKINIPLVQTSVNISGDSVLVSIQEIEKQFGDKKYKPDLIIDAGKLKNKSSKIVDLTTDSVKILRK